MKSKPGSDRLKRLCIRFDNSPLADRYNIKRGGKIVRPFKHTPTRQVVVTESACCTGPIIARMTLMRRTRYSRRAAALVAVLGVAMVAPGGLQALACDGVHALGRSGGKCLA